MVCKATTPSQSQAKLLCEHQQSPGSSNSQSGLLTAGLTKLTELISEQWLQLAAVSS